MRIARILPIALLSACSAPSPAASDVDARPSPVAPVSSSPSAAPEPMINTSVTMGAMLTPGKPDPSCEGFCVKVDKTEVAVGQPVTGVVSWRAAPKNSILSLSLDRADDQRQTIQNAKSEEFRTTGRIETRFDGSLLTAPLPIEGDGSVRFAWSGDGFGCYRTEMAEICPGTASPGPHVIVVTVMDRTTLVHPFAHPDRVRQARPKTVFSGRSRTFTVR